MHDLKLYMHYFDKLGQAIKHMLTTISGAVTMFFVVTLPSLTTTQQTLLLLAVLFVADFITGVWASYTEFKASLPVLPGSGKRYVFSSAKMRMSGVKFITYGLGIVTAYILESIFLIKEFEPSQITTQKLTLTTVVTLFFCAVEFYSIFFENIKRMGFDVLQTIRKIAKDGWGLYKDIKGESKNDEL